jgi:hypothetical protein
MTQKEQVRISSQVLSTYFKFWLFCLLILHSYYYLGWFQCVLLLISLG